MGEKVREIRNTPSYPKRQKKAETVTPVVMSNGQVALKNEDNKFVSHYTDDDIAAFGTLMLKWFKTNPEEFWFKDFAIENDITTDMIDSFARRNAHFARCLKICKDIQESRLVRIGLVNSTKSTMAVFALKNVANWRDDKSKGGNRSVSIPGAVVSTSGTTPIPPRVQDMKSELEEILTASGIEIGTGKDEGVPPVVMAKNEEKKPADGESKA